MRPSSEKPALLRYSAEAKLDKKRIRRSILREDEVEAAASVVTTFRNRHGEDPNEVIVKVRKNGKWEVVLEIKPED